MYAWKVRHALIINMYCANLCFAEMNKRGPRCAELLEKTADALSGAVHSIMLMAVQTDNLELSVDQAIKW
jgi:hypothetical protein